MNTAVGCHALLQGIFLTQVSNPHLLHWPLSKRKRRLDSLEATQGAPRDPRRHSRGERSPWLPLETRPDSPGEPGMQPRPFIILSPLCILSPLRPPPSTFPFRLIGCPLFRALTAVPISFYGIQGSKQEQFEGGCFPGAVGRADREPEVFFFLFFFVEGRE